MVAMVAVLCFHPRLLALTLCSLVACGPSRIAESSQNTTEDSTDSGTTESETQAETDSDSSEQGIFVPPEDMTTEGCDPWQQDCPEGNKCVSYQGEYKCVPVLGDQAPGEPCVSDPTATPR